MQRTGKAGTLPIHQEFFKKNTEPMYRGPKGQMQDCILHRVTRA